MLLYEEHGETSRSVNAEIRDNGDLVILGNDCGKDALEFWGDLDYEFFLAVKNENKERVFNALIEHCDRARTSIPSVSKNKDKALLALLRQVYGGHFSAFDEFWDFLKARGIPAEFSSYV